MKKTVLILLFICLSGILYAQDIPNARAPFEPARNPVPDDRKGKVIQRSFSQSAIYPGTKRNYWIYIPAAYTPDKPACLYVSMDGISFDAPTVFDNLIATGDMPVTIGVFVAPGAISDDENQVIRFNRSNEFDKTDDTFARFLLEELLPDVEKQETSNGRGIKISRDPNDRAIAGNSSGAICAFTVAWQRPDMFSRVFSAIGTYVPMRGGNEYPALIRKTEPKPIRIFLQDGDKDTWNPLFGSWYDANLNIQSALSFAGYEVAHTWGTGGHDGIQANEIFPDVMRWLWKGWPYKVQCGPSKNNMLQQIIDNDSGWEQLAISFIPGEQLISNADGEVYCNDAKGNVYSMAGNNHVNKVMQMPAGGKLLACSGQKLYFADAKGNIFIHENGKKQLLAKDLKGIDGLLVAGNIYAAQLLPEQERAIWLLNSNGNKTLVDRIKHGGVQMALFPNHKMLMTSEENSHWIYSYVISDDGKLHNGQRWYWLHNTDNFDFGRRGGMAFDSSGNLYVATSMGVQVCDHNGRVRAILTLPQGAVSSLCFAGPDIDTIYVIAGDRIYRRKLKVNGVTPDMQPVDVASQGAG